MKFSKWAALLAPLISTNYPLRAQTKKSIFRDSVDNAFDMSTWLAGGGFRYLLARQLGLQMGMDVGWRPDSWAFYNIFGSAWLR